MNKVDLNLKIFNKLPQNLRCKALTITFRIPDGIQRVYFKDQHVSSEMNWQQVSDVKSMAQYIAGNYWNTTNTSATKPSP